MLFTNSCLVDFHTAGRGDQMGKSYVLFVTFMFLHLELISRVKKKWIS